MHLSGGTRVGPYEILAQLGVGGMGEVYQARDTRLGRIVALKFLNERIAAEPGRRQRFETEARAISSLNHANICALFDVGEHDGATFLVMEYVEGETLDDRLTRGAMPVVDVIRYGAQIADALDHAHQQGVIHRDLKPSNVMLTRTGAKLLDFGLARLPTMEARSPRSTISLAPNRLTAEGTILGTFPYMAPEQLEGKEADARTDIFTFGTVVYEMATGRRAFQGQSQASLIAAILERDPPPPSTERAALSPAFDHLVRRCLAKDPSERWQSARDLMFELRWIAERAAEADSAQAPQRSRERLAWSAAGLALLVTVGVVFAAASRRGAGPSQAETRPLMRLDIELPPSASMAIEDQTALALSLDGTRLVYVARTAAGTQLYSRLIDRPNATPIEGTAGGSMPFLSPDGGWVAFFADGKLKKVPIEGGTPVALADAPTSRGGTWAADDTIIYTPGVNGGLMRIPAAGGQPTVLTTPRSNSGTISHRWVEALPDGKSVLFTIWSGFGRWEESRIAVLSLDSLEQRILPLEGAADPHYSKTGHLLYRRAGTIMAVAFDLQKLEATGQPFTVLENVALSIVNNAHFAVSNSGLLVYAPALEVGSVYALRWVDRSGGESSVALSSPALEEPRISPDGERLVLTIREQTNADAWTYHLTRGEFKRLTEEVTEDETPVWMPDNQHVTYSAARPGQPRSIFRRRVDGGNEELLLRTDPSRDDHPHVDSWSPDGQTLALTNMNMATSSENFDIWLLRPQDNPALQPFLQTTFNEGAARFSPDGKWLAYASNESGRYEVYVRPLRGSDRAQPISVDGGTEPVWSRDGTELFFRNGDKMMVSAVRLRPTFSHEKPHLLFERRYASSRRGRLHANYDVSPDGQKFLMLKEIGQTSAPKLSVVLNALR
jgi:eukaryotic-like serine/threonine-protein kinase